MKTEIALHRLTTATENQTELTLKKEDAKLILDRVNYLETLAAALLRSLNDEQRDFNTIIPLQRKRA